MSSATRPPAPREPRGRWVPWLWVGVGVVVLVPLLAVGGLWFALQGGWDGVRPRAGVTDDDVVAARAEAVPQQERTTVDVQDLAAAATGAEVLGVGTLDACDEGWNNWKVDDDFTLRCSLTSASTLGLPAGSDLDAAARALDAALAGAGWSPEDGTGLVDPDQAFPNGRYAAGDDPDLSLVVSIETDYTAQTSTVGTGDSRRIWSEGGVDDAVAAGAAHGGPVVELAVERRYFEDD